MLVGQQRISLRQRRTWLEKRAAFGGLFQTALMDFLKAFLEIEGAIKLFCSTSQSKHL
jgi:hypothetical protein